MLIYYIEGDRGHLMEEIMGEQRSRTVVRGSACTYQMPWEEIIRDLGTHCLEEGSLTLPRAQDSLKYFVRVHLNVAGVDMKKYMKQLHVRPFVLLRLLQYLIDSKHEVYRQGNVPAQELMERLRKRVEQEYPETEAHLPEGKRQGAIPASVQQVLDDFQEETAQQARSHNRTTTDIGKEEERNSW